MNKARLVEHLSAILQERVDAAQHAIDSARASFANDTKSSAGDKHEVGRAMVQQELDKLEMQRANVIALQAELARVPLQRIYERVAFGSLVTTDHGIYFTSIGLGMVEVDGVQCFAISLASPIGQALKDGSPGEAILFNGRTMVIVSVR